MTPARAYVVCAGLDHDVIVSVRAAELWIAPCAVCPRGVRFNTHDGAAFADAPRAETTAESSVSVEFAYSVYAAAAMRELAEHHNRALVDYAGMPSDPIGARAVLRAFWLEHIRETPVNHVACVSAPIPGRTRPARHGHMLDVCRARSLGGEAMLVCFVDGKTLETLTWREYTQVTDAHIAGMCCSHGARRMPLHDQLPIDEYYETA
jgi:hypothetical protein